MAQVSITRLRLRRFWLIPIFMFQSLRIQKQARDSDGCLAAQINNFAGAFWTLTLWRDRAAMRAFMMNGIHREVMPKLAGWCDEASLAHWDEDRSDLPDWKDAVRRLGAEGRVSAVKHPSPAHAAGKPLGSSATS